MAARGDNIVAREPIVTPDGPTDTTWVEEGPRFRLNVTQVFLTYAAHIEMKRIHTYISAKWAIKDWLACHETGETGHRHTHMAITFEKKVDIRKANAFDLDGLHPNIGKCRKWVACIAYITKAKNPIIEGNVNVEGLLKENPLRARRAGVHTEDVKTICERIWAANSPAEAILAGAHTLRDVQAVLSIYGAKREEMPQDVKDYYKDFVPREWQSFLYNLLQNEPDRRSVIWIVDPEGGKGKSLFTSWYESTKDECVSITSIGREADAADVIRNWMEARGNRAPKSVLFDLPRRMEKTDVIYSTIEAIKNGNVTCTKYKGKKMYFRPPHVVVFANWWPHTHGLSVDRWRLYKLVDITEAGETKSLMVPMTVEHAEHANGHNEAIH